MAKITTYSQLVKEIKNRVNKTLNDESSGSVFDVVKKTEQKHIDSDVYDVYNPKIYERRDMDDGLIADSNIVKDVKDTTLSVTNITKPNPKYNGTMDKNLPELIEYGIGYKGYRYDYPGKPYIDPRPFTENTIKNLKTTNVHVEALKKGLKKEGLNIK